MKGVLNVMAAFLAHSSLSLSKSHGSGTSEKEKEKEKKEGEEENLPVLIAINTGMAHLPYFGPFAAYASSKAAAAKLLEYVQVEEAGRVRMHNLQPGIIRTEMGSKADVPAEVYDDSMFFQFPHVFHPSCQRNEHAPDHPSLTRKLIKNLACSPPPRPLLRLAGKPRSSVPQRKVRLGELGCGGAEGEGRGDSKG